MWSKICYPVAKPYDFDGVNSSDSKGVIIDDRLSNVTLNADLTTLYARIEFGRSDDRMNSNYSFSFLSNSTELYIGTSSASEIKDITLGGKAIGAIYMPHDSYTRHHVLKVTINRGTNGFIKIQMDDNAPFTYSGKIS